LSAKECPTWRIDPMSAAHDAPTRGDEEITTLRVHRAGQIDAPAACRALLHADWLGELVHHAEVAADTTRYLTDLVLPLPPDGRLLQLRKAAYVDIGTPAPRPDGGCLVDVAWRSASLAPLFPVFAGFLTVSPTGLRLDGNYAPPGGFVGRTADRMLLHIAARGTARWFLGHLATTLRS
jgi:hypothetical protein